MSTLKIQDTVGEIVARYPSYSRVFEAAGVDYCCGGKRTLDEVCREKGLDPEQFLTTLQESALSTDDDTVVDAAAMSLTELADHILETHHAYLQSELPRLYAITERVATVHGESDTRLRQVHQTFASLAAELTSHMRKEEQILFPLIRQLDAGDAGGPMSISNPIRQMESEHHDAGDALRTLRTLTDDYKPPQWACNTYRAMLDGLAYLERDMYQHVHKEDNVLYPRALELETSRGALELK